MLDIDHEKMFTLLKVPWAITLNDILAVSKRKLTSVKQELNSKFSTQETYQALVKGFQKVLEVKFLESEFIEYEQKLVKKIRKERFVTEDWNLLGKASI
jgi:lipoate-protein ligase A